MSNPAWEARSIAECKLADAWSFVAAATNLVHVNVVAIIRRQITSATTEAAGRARHVVFSCTQFETARNILVITLAEIVSVTTIDNAEVARSLCLGVLSFHPHFPWSRKAPHHSPRRWIGSAVLPIHGHIGQITLVTPFQTAPTVLDVACDPLIIHCKPRAARSSPSCS